MFSTASSARRIIVGFAMIAIALSANATFAGAKKGPAPRLKLGDACTCTGNAVFNAPGKCGPTVDGTPGEICGY